MLRLKLILVRHGETRLNKDGRIQGVNSVPLNNKGRAQAQAVARALEKDLPFELYTSPLTRALETAQIISETVRVPPKPLKELEEADAGDLEGLTGEEMRRRYPEFVKRWAQDSGTAQMPGGESLLQVQERAWWAITEFMLNHPNDTVVAVTHNFTIQTVVCKVLEMPLSYSRRLRQDVGAITRLELSDSQSTLVSLNETWHLTPLDDLHGGVR